MEVIDCIVKSGLASDKQLEDLRKRLENGEDDEKIKKDFINDYHKKLFDDLNGLKEKVKLPKEKYTPIPEPNTEDIHKKYDAEKEKLNQQYNKVEGEKRGAGLAQRVQEKRRDVLGITPYEKGQGWNKEEALSRGEELAKDGMDVNDIFKRFAQDERVSPDEMARLQYESIRLAKETQNAADKFGEDSPEYKEALKNENDFLDKAQPLKTASSKTFTAQQGEVDLDTGSFTSIKNEFKKVTDGGVPNKSQEAKIKELTDQNQKLQKQSDELEKKVIELTDKALNEGDNKTKPEKGKFEKKARDLAAKIMKAELPSWLKIDDPNAKTQGIGIEAAKKLLADATINMGKLLDKGIEFTEAVKEAVKDLVAAFGEDRRSEIEKNFPQHYNELLGNTPEGRNIKRLEKQLEDLRKGIAKQTSPKRELTEREKRLQDEIFEAKKNLGLIPSKDLPTAKIEKTAEQKNIERLEKELEDARNGIFKQSSEKRTVSDIERDLQEQIKAARESAGLVKSKSDKPLTEQEQIEEDNKELEGLQNKFANKKDNKFSIDEAKSIWDYAKKNYLDKGVKYRDMIKQVSQDLGLSWKQVSEGITSPKTKPISDAMWKKQGELRRAQNVTKLWIDQQSRSIYVRALLKASAAVRGLQVFGHAGVFMGTHAGMTLAQPRTWKYTVPAFFRAYKFAYGNDAAYEKSLEELKSRPLYDRFQRMGLKNNPDQVNAEEFQKSQSALGGWLKKVGLQGIKGFNALKVLRQDLAEYHYRKLTAEEKKDDGAVRSIVRLVNNATGATNLKLPTLVNEMTFAGGMEAARWGKLTRNPMRATAIAIKAMMHPEKATTEEKVFAKVWASRVGEQLATYGGLLFANSAIQSVVNPNNPTNIFHPNRKDWLRPKFGGITVDPTSGMMSTVDFIKNIGEIPFKNNKELHGDTKSQAFGKSLIGRARGKLAPFYSTLYDMVTQTDYNGNQLPLSNLKPDAQHRNIGWLEYATQRLPIPIAEGLHEMFQSAADNGTSPAEASNIFQALLLTGISGTTGARAGESSKERPSPYTEATYNKPSFKMVKDWGMELPNTSHASEDIPIKATGKMGKLSEQPKETQDKYDQLHETFLEKELDEVRKRGYVNISYGKVSQDGKRTKLSDLTQDQRAEILRNAQSQATTKTKQKLFPK